MSKDNGSSVAEGSAEYLTCFDCGSPDFDEHIEVRLTAGGVIEEQAKYRCLKCHKLYRFVPEDGLQETY